MIKNHSSTEGKIMINPAQSGQVLPGTLMVLTLIAMLMLALSWALNEHATGVFRHEVDVLTEARESMSALISLNGIVLNNKTIKAQLESLLTSIESSLTSGFSISASALLWENQLPIPEPHNVFHRMLYEASELTTLSRFISRNNSGLADSLRDRSDVKILWLTIGQSLCQLPCFDRTWSAISGTDCRQTEFISDRCELTLRKVPVIPSRLKSIPLREVVPQSLWKSSGILVIAPGPKTSGTPIANSLFRHALVHPALCQTQFTSFSLPCPNKSISLKSGARFMDHLSFEPHWSITFEK